MQAQFNVVKMEAACAELESKLEREGKALLTHNKGNVYLCA